MDSRLADIPWKNIEKGISLPHGKTVSYSFQHRLSSLISVCPAKALNHAFIWNSSTGMVDLGTLPDGQDSFARAINDNGQVAGYAYLSDGVTTHGFIWTEATGMVDIGTPGRKSRRSQ